MSAQTLPTQNPIATMTATFWPDSYFYTPWSSGLCDDFGNTLAQWKTYKEYIQWLISTAAYGGDDGNHFPCEVEL